MQKNLHLLPLRYLGLHIPNPDVGCSWPLEDPTLFPEDALPMQMTFLSPLNCFGALCQNQLTLSVYFWTRYSVSLIYCLSLHKNHTILMIFFYSFTVSLELDNYIYI